MAVKVARSSSPVDNFSLWWIVQFEVTRWTIRHSLMVLWFKVDVTFKGFEKPLDSRLKILYKL